MSDFGGSHLPTDGLRSGFRIRASDFGFQTLEVRIYRQTGRQPSGRAPCAPDLDMTLSSATPTGRFPAPRSQVSGLGFRVSSFGCQVSGLGLRVSGSLASGFGFRVSGLGIRVSGFGCRVQFSDARLGLGSVFGCQIRTGAVSGLGFRISGFGLRISGPGFRFRVPAVDVSSLGLLVSGFWRLGIRVQDSGLGFRASPGGI